jgi:hypothetical protein
MKNEGRKRTSNAALVESPKPAFEINHFYERVLDLRQANPRAFNSLAPVTKLALGAYEAQKREAARLQAIRTEPVAE